MRDAQGRPSYPVRFTNKTEETIPPWGVIRLVGGDYDSEDQLLYPRAKHPTGDSSDALFVNSASPVEPEQDGHCRSIRDDPFWVAVNGGDSDGGQVGPEADSFIADTEGSGFTVIYRDNENSKFLCSAAVSTGFAIIQLKDDLEECGESADGYFIVDEECFDWNIGEGLSGAANSVEVCPSAGWKGVAFGGNTFQEHSIGGTEYCDWGDIILARRDGEKWMAVGAGHLALTGIADNAVEEFEEGDFTVDVKIGDCHYGAGDGLIFPCPSGETRSKTIKAKVYGGDVSEGQAVTLTWRGNGWDAAVAAVEAGCGLRIEEAEEDGEENPDAGKIRVDENIAGCGLDWDEDACQLKVDNDDLAGNYITADDGDGVCSLSVDQDLIDRIEELEECCEANTACCAAMEECCETLTEIITDLIECCEDSRQCCYESMQCCYENSEDIRYIQQYCCDDPPPESECTGACVWRWPDGGTAVDDWELIVPCAGDDCDCQRPTSIGTEAGDLEFTDCEGSGSAGQSACCGGTVPEEVTLTFEDLESSPLQLCPCADGAEVTLTWNGDLERWENTAASIGSCGTENHLYVTCSEAGVWTLWQDGCGTFGEPQTEGPADSTDCDAPAIVWNQVILYNACVGGAGCDTKVTLSW